MKNTKSVTLSAPILFHDKSIRELTFAEPKWKDVEELGPPDQLMRSGDMLSVTTFPAIVSQYAERTIQPLENFPLLLMLPLQDVLRVHEAIGDFFREARAANAGSTVGSQSSSSSNAASA
ncbi:phage tail assembly protein [Bosea sp. PAMC 26642]|uniref:phage tail assembly protein n=1 Tax=Bosea sp. (strain PAMC 26642) TaxID=1792307 RepID=UPI0007703DDD|nr:phage tail assembly protein [Bosea sp. PAMC 26642]AMJ60939.1 hypothetical protein AXW83_12110 [Bosea sp. PAMC 26642]